MQTLQDHSWRIGYSSNEHNPILDFYIPALERSVHYDRKSGFFSSAILSKVAQGLGVMLRNNGKMRLIMGCQFSPQDLEAIKQGYALRDAIATRLDTELTPPQTFAQLKHFEILSWLIQHEYLDIKIAVPLKKNGIPESPTEQLDPQHIFHEKVGIFTDTVGNQLVCFGSNNESLGGWERNVESFHVYCSWEGRRDLERVNEEVFRFEQLWNNLAPNVKSFDIPEAVRQKLLRYTPTTKPDWTTQAEFDVRPLPRDKQIQVNQLHGEETVTVEGDDQAVGGASRSLACPNDNEQDSKRLRHSEHEGMENSEQDARTPNPDQQITNNQQPITNNEIEGFTSLLSLHNHPGCLDFCLKSIPIQPWLHQIKILRRVAKTFPCNFLIADEVGLGKTIETGLILRYLLLSQKVQRVLVLAPASVQPQWQEELREKFNLHFWSYSQGRLEDPYGNVSQPGVGASRSLSYLQNSEQVDQDNSDQNYKENSDQDGRTPNNQQPITNNPLIWNQKDLILASSHLVRRQDRMQELLEAEPWDLVVLDEAHHARRKSPQQRKDTPNSLLTLMQQLRAKGKAKSLILLSATPMQIDPIEVFDLLHLLGLQGHWQYGENFCNYFSTLPDKPDKFALDFWQSMSTDYFRYGGNPCPRLQTYLENSDRLLTYKLKDMWQSGKKFVNHKPYLRDTEFINTSRQYLSVNTPLKDLMFRHTRDTLRQYYRRGMLERDVPTRIVQDHAISLEANREIPLYRAVSDYVRNFYRLAQKQERKALGFLMTLYRKRLTSSFYAIRESLQRRLEGISITPDDLLELDETEDAVIQGLESYLAEPVDPKEIEYLEDLLRQFENTGEDSKLSYLITILRQEFLERDTVLLFTQYTDTMDYLRGELQQLYGTQVACYSGRGGERYEGGGWKTVPKEQIKRMFRDREIKLLLCTESASEGLNLQTCGVLINYDLPWNPMRVEQRIGRLDRIGQRYETVRIHNFYYDGTVEAKVYRRLRDRINLFTNVVGHLQPILAQVPTFIERTTMSADPQEEDVLMAEFEQSFDIAPMRPSLDEMVTMDIEADLEEVRQPLSPTPITPEGVEQLLTNSQILRSKGFYFEDIGDRLWQLHTPKTTYRVTFYPEVFEEMPSVRLMNFGEPLFEALVHKVEGTTA